MKRKRTQHRIRWRRKRFSVYKRVTIGEVIESVAGTFLLRDHCGGIEGGAVFVDGAIHPTPLTVT